MKYKRNIKQIIFHRLKNFSDDRSRKLFRDRNEFSGDRHGEPAKPSVIAKTGVK